MPETDITALLHSLHNVGKDSDTGTKDEQDEAANDQRERIALRQQATQVGLVVHAATDPETLRSLIVRKDLPHPRPAQAR